MNSLELEDLKHRYQHTYAAFKPKNGTDFLVGYFTGFGEDLDNPEDTVVKFVMDGVEVNCPPENVLPIAPSPKYINIAHKGSLFCFYISKSAERYYKKGFSLGYNSSSVGPMFYLSNPIQTHIKLLNVVSPHKFYANGKSLLSVPSQSEISKNISFYYKIAVSAYRESGYPRIPVAKNEVHNPDNRSVCVALSENFCLGVSSNTDYMYNLYSGLFHLGYLSGNDFYVDPLIKQELLDYLQRTGQGNQYAVNSL